jgi:hypothetical protein
MYADVVCAMDHCSARGAQRHIVASRPQPRVPAMAPMSGVPFHTNNRDQRNTAQHVIPRNNIATRKITSIAHTALTSKLL